MMCNNCDSTLIEGFFPYEEKFLGLLFKTSIFGKTCPTCKEHYFELRETTSFELCIPILLISLGMIDSQSVNLCFDIMKGYNLENGIETIMPNEEIAMLKDYEKDKANMFILGSIAINFIVIKKPLSEITTDSFKYITGIQSKVNTIIVPEDKKIEFDIDELISNYK